ncbi:MAG: carboxypeptidase regulatory-like domain-containing protein [Acidobacteriota bacterium]
MSSQGQGLSAARVTLYETAPFEQADAVSTDAASSEDGAWRGAPVLATRSGEDGHFELAWESAGSYTLVVEAAGFLPWEYPLLLVESISLPTVALAKATEHQVSVSDVEGAAIPGAWVRVAEASRWSRRNESFGDWIPAVQLSRSDASGVSRISRETVRGVELVVWAPGHVETMAFTGKSRRNTVRLARGVERTLEVRGPSGDVVAGVAVRVGVGRWPVGVTREDGRLVVVGPADGSLDVELIGTDGAWTTVELGPPIAASSKADVVRLESRELAGQVRSAGSGEGLAGALVWFDDERDRVAWSDPTGAFRLAVPASRDDVELFVEAVGHRRLRAAVDVATDVDLTLDRALSMMGVVVDDDGRPVTGAEIQVHTDLARNHFLEPPLAVAARSDDQGRFLLSGLPVAPQYEVVARAPGFAAMPFTVTPTNDELRLVLSRGVATAGMIFDAWGKPVANASALLYPSRESDRSRLLVDDVHVGQSAADGRFFISAVVPGRYELGISAPGFAPMTVRGLEIEDSNRPVDLGAVYLEREAVLEGRVTDADGLPIEGVKVSFLSLVYEVGPGDDRLSTEKMTYTGPDGSFALGQLQAGQQVDLELRRSGYRALDVFGVDVPVPDPLEVVLERNVEVSGRVVDADGEPVVAAQVVVRDPKTTGDEMAGRVRQTATSDGRGQFVLTAELSGRFLVTASAPGYRRSAEVEVVVRDGVVADEVVLVVETGTQLTGRITNVDGEPVAGARLRVVDPPTPPAELVKETRSRRDGSYDLGGLETGRTTVEVVHDAHPRATRVVELRSEQHRLDIALRDGFAVEGWVRDTAGAALSGVRLLLEGDESGRRSTVSEVDGDFRFTGLTSGRYDLRASREGYAETSRVVDVDGATSLEVELRAGGVITGLVSGLEPAELERVQIEARQGGTRVVGTMAYDGQYRLESLDVGSWRVDATLSDGSGRQASASATIDGDRTETYLDLDFSQGLVVSGEVVRAGIPVGGALVGLIGEDFSTTRSQRSDLRGRFRLSGLEVGVYELTIRDIDTGRVHRQVVELDTDRELFVDFDG